MFLLRRWRLLAWVGCCMPDKKGWGDVLVETSSYPARTDNTQQANKSDDTGQGECRDITDNLTYLGFLEKPNFFRVGFLYT